MEILFGILGIVSVYALIMFVIFSIRMEYYYWLEGACPSKFDDKEVWFNRFGDIHRNNGPAIIFENGDIIYCRKGLRHKDDGPAVITFSFTAWYKDGNLHNESGPAIIYSDGTKKWYLDDMTVTPEEVFKKLPKEKQIEIMFNSFDEWTS